MQTDTKISKVHKLIDATNYCNRIKNAKKQVYARKYLMAKYNDEPEPTADGISYMAAQAVRMNLNKILES